jgi:heme/copper-type cytochrome/quinol oxidase subunit 2
MSLALVVGVSVAVLPAMDASAINVFNNCSGAGSTTVCGAAGTDSATSMAKIIVNTLLVILGILAVIMIIVGGIRYTTSAGDASRVKAAKDTVMYSVVGLVVAILAFAIVNFVTTQFK